MRPWRIHWRRKTRQKKRNIKIQQQQQQQQAAANNNYFLEYVSFTNQKCTAQSRCEYQVLVRITSRTASTTTKKLEVGPAAKGRDKGGQMHRSHASPVRSCRSTSVASAQRKNCRYTSASTHHPDGTTKEQISYLVFRRPPDRRGTLKSIKQHTQTNAFYHSFVRVRQLSTYQAYSVYHICAEISHHPLRS